MSRHSIAAGAPLAAGIGADQVQALYNGLPLSQWCGAKVPRMQFHSRLGYFVAPETPISLGLGLDRSCYESVNTWRSGISCGW